MPRIGRGLPRVFLVLGRQDVCPRVVPPPVTSRAFRTHHVDFVRRALHARHVGFVQVQAPASFVLLKSVRALFPVPRILFVSYAVRVPGSGRSGQTSLERAAIRLQVPRL